MLCKRNKRKAGRAKEEGGEKVKSRNFAFCLFLNFGFLRGWPFPYFQIFHFGTAQQVGDQIDFTAVCLGTKFDMTFDSKIWLSNTSVSPGLVYNYTIDLTNEQCTRTQVDRASVEFPTTHPYRNGMTGTRFNYLMACDRPGFNLPYMDVVKVSQPL